MQDKNNVLNIKQAKANEYVKFPKGLMILWIIILIFTLILTIFSLIMLIFDISYNNMQSIYMSNSTTYEGYTIQELIVPSSYQYYYELNSGDPAWYGSYYFISYSFQYNDSRLPTDPNSIDAEISLNQYIATQILMIYPDLYLSAAGYSVSNGPGTYGYEFANLFYNWLLYATNTDNNIYHSLGIWETNPEPGTVSYLSTGEAWMIEDPVWLGDSIYSIFGLTPSSIDAAFQGNTTRAIFYMWSSSAIVDFWYQDWWNSDYFNYESSIPTIYYDYDSYVYGEMDKQIIDSLRILMPATSGYSTSNLFPTTFVSGDQITNLPDNTLSNHVYIVFQQEESVLNPTNINNTDSIWGATTHDPKMYVSMTTDSKSIALSIIQNILIFTSLILVILIFTPLYRKNQKLFNSLNLVIPLILIITMVIMLINFSFWINFDSEELINNLKPYDSFVALGPDQVSVDDESWDLMFHYYEGYIMSLTVDQNTNGGVYASIMGDNSLTFEVTRLLLVDDDPIFLDFVIAGSFNFYFGPDEAFLSALTVLNNISFITSWLGLVLTYFIIFISLCCLIIIWIYGFFVKDIKIALEFNEIKSVVDKKINQMNKTTSKIDSTINKNKSK